MNAKLTHPPGPITITHAYTQRGWDPGDHLIDDSRMSEIIGRHYASVSHAMSAARARADRRGYAAIQYVVQATGERWERGDDPALPGRNPLCKRVANQ